jgi:hypothetical protein
MTVNRKVYVCRIGENTHLDTKEKWIARFNNERFADNVVAYNTVTGEMRKVTDLQEELEHANTHTDYFFAVVDEVGTQHVADTDRPFVSGYFVRSNRHLSSLVNFDNGEVSDVNLSLRENASTVSRFLYFADDRTMYFEYNKNGASYFDGKFYRYLDALFGEDAVKIVPIMKPDTMEQVLRGSVTKKIDLKVASSNHRLVKKIIGLPVTQQFAASIGEENYNIEIIISSNRNSSISSTFAGAILDNFKLFRRKDEIKKLEFTPEDGEGLDLTSQLRYMLQRDFDTESARSKRITRDSFKTIVFSDYDTHRADIFEAIGT